jgi:murein DD-endopeptidase MepM/ murein hydrolase activator NlpD
MKDFFGEKKYKKIIIAFWITLIVAIATFVIIFITFSQKLKNTADMGLLTLNTTTSVVPNSIETKEASTTSDKDINEVAKETLNQISNGTSGTTGNIASKEEVTLKNTSISNSSNITINSNTALTSVTEDTKTNSAINEEEKKLEFQAPVSGEIIVDYADESLVYSETLEEWTTHLGVDIKANKASSVSASEEGTVKSIKNDPRYGLTITISHSDGYETVYSNLLSADFVAEGDMVEKGQTIGTVGESASFEVAEVPHLHFEIYKDGESVNPTTLLK